jgi:hypothetical protein
MAEIAEKHPFLTHGGFRKSPDTVLGALSLNKKSQISKDSGILGMNGFSRGRGAPRGADQAAFKRAAVPSWSDFAGIPRHLSVMAQKMLLLVAASCVMMPGSWGGQSSEASAGFGWQPAGLLVGQSRSHDMIDVYVRPGVACVMGKLQCIRGGGSGSDHESREASQDATPPRLSLRHEVARQLAEEVLYLTFPL